MIFLDNASTTILDEQCLEIIKKFGIDEFYNPSARYHSAILVKNAIDNARITLLKEINAVSGDIIFTASGTEADNLAVFGTKKQLNSKIIISKSEHPAVYNAAMELKQKGYIVLEAETDKTGRVIEEKFEKMMDKDVSFVSIMTVNNETGAVNDIKKLCKIAKAINKNVIFHTDAIQAAGKIKINVSDTNVDLLSISGHKFHSPKGVGALYVKNINLRPIIFGGGQENGIRSATENVAGIVCMANCLHYYNSKILENYDKIQLIKNYIINNLDEDKFLINSTDNCSPYILNIAMKFVRGEVMLHALEKHNILIGTGSACSSNKSSKRIPSLFNLPKIYEKGIIRISFDQNTCLTDIKYFIDKLNLEYKQLEKYMKG